MAKADFETTARKLLELSVEYVNYEAAEAVAAPFGIAPERSRDEIASEYSATLRELLG